MIGNKQKSSILNSSVYEHAMLESQQEKCLTLVLGEKLFRKPYSKQLKLVTKKTQNIL